MRSILLFILYSLGFGSLGAQQTVGLFTHRDGAVDGYGLLAPFSSDTIYLIDNCGREVHRWNSGYRLGSSAYLLDNGDLVRLSSRTNTPFANLATCGVIEWLTWEGELVWEFDLSSTSICAHHDLAVLPNGNVLVLAYGYKTEAEALAAGRDSLKVDEQGFWEEIVFEIQPTGDTTGQIVWEWHSWDHMVQDYDPSKDNYGLPADHPELFKVNFPMSPFANGPTDPDWLHNNSIDYHPEWDQIMVSSRHNSEIWVIDHSTSTAEAAGHTGGNYGKGGDLLYRWGNPQIYLRGNFEDQVLYAQHNARWITGDHPWTGKVMVFNNGDPSRPYSSVEVIQPPVDALGNYTLGASSPFGPTAIDWTYPGEDGEFWYASFISGAQPLADGHVLICDGPAGRVFEVDSLGEKYWEYVNPVSNLGVQVQGQNTGSNFLFRMDRYPVDHPGLAGRDLEPGGRIELSPLSLPAICLVNDSMEVVEDWTVYPMPADQEVRLLRSNSEPIRVRIFDPAGRLVKGPFDLSEDEPIDVSSFSPGMYFLRIEGEVNIQKPLLIQRD